FMFNITISYPTREEEVRIVKATTTDQEATLTAVLKAAEVMELQKLVRQVPVSDHVVTYATDLARATRPHEPGAPAFVKECVEWGAGPRASQYLVVGAKARAILLGRPAAGVSDVKAVALPVLRHRVFTSFNADSEGITREDVIKKLLEQVPPPREGDY
ncbi:MAG: MoxR family ATPase, partial [Planctomycetes bacterium]|nr:MoxR family ATPase [Planctomycetota bacterium]